MDHDSEQVNIADRGRRIFEALRRGREDPEPAASPAATDAERAQAERADAEHPQGEGTDLPEPEQPAPDREGENSQVQVETSRTEPGEPAEASQMPGEPDAAPMTPPVEAEPTPEPPTVVSETPPPGRPIEETTGEVPRATIVEPHSAPPVQLPRVMAIANQKGGVGKTTTAVNLGAALSELGYRVLVVDLDPQGNATTGLGIDMRNLERSIYEVLMAGADIEDCIEPTSVRNLFVAPATIDLAGAEIELVPMFSRELKLRRAIESVKDDYDYVVIDCPPSLGLLTVNGLAAADDVIVPIQCEYYALEGLGQLVNNVQLVRANLNPVLDIRGIVLTMYDARTKLSDQVVNEVRTHFSGKVYQTIVPRTVRLSEAPSFGQPIIVFDPSSRGAIAYRELAKEVSRGATRRAG